MTVGDLIGIRRKRPPKPWGNCPDLGYPPGASSERFVYNNTFSDARYLWVPKQSAASLYNACHKRKKQSDRDVREQRERERERERGRERERERDRQTDRQTEGQ